MPHHSLDDGQAVKSVMTALEVTASQDSLSKLTEIIDNKSEHEHLVILCENKGCRKLVLALLGKRIKSCIFIDDMCEDTLNTIAQEIDHFKEVKIAVCSFKAMLSMNLPPAEKYLFWEVPITKKSYLPKVLNLIENSAAEDKPVPHVDVLFSLPGDSAANIALYLELKQRGMNIPTSLYDYILNLYATPEIQKKYSERCQQEKENAQREDSMRSATKEIESATDTTESAGSSFASNSCENGTVTVKASSISQPSATQPKRNVNEKPFDIWNMKPDANGLYHIPAHVITSENPITDDDSVDEDETNYDADYDYESYSLDYEDYDM